MKVYSLYDFWNLLWSASSRGLIFVLLSICIFQDFVINYNYTIDTPFYTA